MPLTLMQWREWAKLEDRDKAERTWATRLEHAWNKGYERGLQEAQQLRLQEGRQEGRKEVLLEVARRMKQAGIPVDTVLQLTGVTSEDLDP